MYVHVYRHLLLVAISPHTKKPQLHRYRRPAQLPMRIFTHTLVHLSTKLNDQPPALPPPLTQVTALHWYPSVKECEANDNLNTVVQILPTDTDACDDSVRVRSARGRRCTVDGGVLHVSI